MSTVFLVNSVNASLNWHVQERKFEAVTYASSTVRNCILKAQGKLFFSSFSLRPFSRCFTYGELPKPPDKTK